MILVIDPNKFEYDQISEELQNVYPDKDVVTVSSLDEALPYIKHEDVDICFMEPYMDNVPSSRIIDILRCFRRDVIVNFIADTDEYALMGWNLKINDYLLRPLTLESIIHAQQRAQTLT